MILDDNDKDYHEWFLLLYNYRIMALDITSD